MKRFSRMMMAFVAVAALCFSSCGKDENKDDNPSSGGSGLSSLVGTAWVGVYNDTYQGYPARMVWSMDFLSESEGEMFFEITVGGQAQPSHTIPFTYTFDGATGLINAGAIGAAPFTYNPQDSTLTVVLMVEVEGDGATLGGETVFYLRGTGHDPSDEPGNDDPNAGDGVEPGEITNEFPANTSWLTSEEISYPVEGVGDIPVTLRYELVFQNDHIALMNIYAEALGTVGDPQTIRFNWTYDNASHAGTLTTRGTPLPYHYNPDDDTMEGDFNFNTGDGTSTGGHMIFTRVDAPTLRIALR